MKYIACESPYDMRAPDIYRSKAFFLNPLIGNQYRRDGDSEALGHLVGVWFEIHVSNFPYETYNRCYCNSYKMMDLYTNGVDCNDDKESISPLIHLNKLQNKYILTSPQLQRRTPNTVVEFSCNPLISSAISLKQVDTIDRSLVVLTIPPGRHTSSGCARRF